MDHACAQDDWYRRAQLAVEKGDDELAKEALKRRKSNQENADTMKAQLDQQRAAVEQLIGNTKCAPVCMPRPGDQSNLQERNPGNPFVPKLQLLIIWHTKNSSQGVHQGVRAANM